MKTIWVCATTETGQATKSGSSLVLSEIGLIDNVIGLHKDIYALPIRREKLKGSELSILPKEELRKHILNLFTIAASKPTTSFRVIPLDTGINCPSSDFWLELFADAPENVILPFNVTKKQNYLVIAGGASIEAGATDSILFYVQKMCSNLGTYTIITGSEVIFDALKKIATVKLIKPNWDEYKLAAGRLRNVQVTHFATHLLCLDDESSDIAHLLDLAYKTKTPVRKLALTKKEILIV
jgi:hypothetical protein